MKTQQRIQQILKQDLESLKNYPPVNHTVQAQTRLEQWQQHLENELIMLSQNQTLSLDTIEVFLVELNTEIEHCKAKLRNLDIQADWRFDYYRLLRGLRYDVLTLKELTTHSH